MQLWWLVVVVLDCDNGTGHINKVKLSWIGDLWRVYHSTQSGHPSMGHGQVQCVLAIAEEEMASSA